MAANARRTQRTLSDAARIRARPADFGAELETLLRVGGNSLAPRTVAWGGSVFKREVDAQQDDDLAVHALLKRGAKHLDARRVRSARSCAAKLGRASQRLDELPELAHEWNTGSDDRILVFTSLVGLKHRLVEAGFRTWVPATADALRDAVVAAWSSAYELNLLEDLAQHSVRRFSLAVALSWLPSYLGRGELFLRPPDAPDTERAPVARFVGVGDPLGWFDPLPHSDAAAPEKALASVRRATQALCEAFPEGAYAEFCVDNEGLCLTTVRNVPAGPARWLAWDGDFGAVSTHLGRSLLSHFERSVVRPLLDELGVRSRRQSPWVAATQGRPYLNLALLQLLGDALDASPALLEALAGGSLRPVEAPRDQRFRAPRLLAELALLDTRLRSRVREFQTRSLRHARWFEELDLAILPDDALPTTLRETQQFMDTAGGLYLEAELALVRALSGLADLGSDGNQLDLKHLFPTLIVDEELASVAHCDDFNTALLALHADPVALAAVHAGAGSLLELPEGRARRELAYFRRHHGFWTDAGTQSSGASVDVDEGAFFRALMKATPLPIRERARRKRSALELRHAATRLLAGSNGWLGRQALNTMLERVASFARMHETMRVTLVRSYLLLRHVSLDAGRRLARLNPELHENSVWHLGFDELCSAVQYADSDLASLVEERARCQRQRRRRPATARRMVELTSTPCAPSLGSRIRGAPTATGKFLGRVRWLGDLSDKHPASGDEVIVANSFSAGHSLMIGHAGAIVSASGGPFSHTAFIARQLGVPAVVGLGESVAALKQGDEVLVDGTEGVVLRTLRGFARH